VQGPWEVIQTLMSQNDEAVHRFFRKILLHGRYRGNLRDHAHGNLPVCRGRDSKLVRCTRLDLAVRVDGVRSLHSREVAGHGCHHGWSRHPEDFGGYAGLVNRGGRVGRVAHAARASRAPHEDREIQVDRATHGYRVVRVTRAIHVTRATCYCIDWTNGLSSCWIDAGMAHAKMRLEGWHADALSPKGEAYRLSSPIRCDSRRVVVFELPRCRHLGEHSPNVEGTRLESEAGLLDSLSGIRAPPIHCCGGGDGGLLEHSE